ncbi:hypothetical protein [Brevibacillus sp. NRS-1366]
MSRELLQIVEKSDIAYKSIMTQTTLIYQYLLQKGKRQRQS